MATTEFPWMITNDNGVVHLAVDVKFRLTDDDRAALADATGPDIEPRLWYLAADRLTEAANRASATDRAAQLTD